MSDSSSSSTGRIGLSGFVFIVFLVLKLLGKIDWSWWWVTCPLWGPLLLALTIIVICALFKIWEDLSNP